MTNAQLKNIGMYVLIALAGAVVATGVQFGAVLSGTDEIAWRPLAATFVSTLFAALVTAGGSAFRPRAGREDISGLVSEVGAGQARAVLEVEAVRQQTGINGLTPEQTAQIAEALVTPLADELELRKEERVKSRLLRNAATEVNRG